MKRILLFLLAISAFGQVPAPGGGGSGGSGGNGSAPWIYAADQSGAEYGAKINAAMAALPAAGGVVILPKGVLTVSTTISITKNGISIIGQGDASLLAVAPTTLNWTGGASPVITSSSNRDLVLKDFNIDNNGTATIGINLVSDTSNLFNIVLDHVSETNPAVKFSAQGIKVSSTGSAVSTYLTFRKVWVALAAPTGLYIDKANIVLVDDSTIMNNTNRNIDVGPSNIVVTFRMQVFARFGERQPQFIAHAEFRMQGGSAEIDSGSGESATAIGIALGTVYAASIEGTYFETQQAGQFAINVSTNTIGVDISDCFFNSPTTTTTYAINVTNGSFPVSIHDNMFDNYVTAGIISNAPTHLATRQNSAAGNTPIVISGGEGAPTVSAIGLGTANNSAFNLAGTQNLGIFFPSTSGVCLNGGGTTVTACKYNNNTMKLSTADLLTWHTDSAETSSNKDTGISRQSAGIVQLNSGTAATGGHLAVGANCIDSAGAAACGAASAGSFVIDATTTSTVVSTTAVTANSQIFLLEDSSLGTRLSVTCNTQSVLTLGPPVVTARTAGTSFTATIITGPTTNPMCVSYFIVN